MTQPRSTAKWRPALRHLFWVRRLRLRPVHRREVGGGQPLRYLIFRRRAIGVSVSAAMRLAVRMRTIARNLTVVSPPGRQRSLAERSGRRLASAPEARAGSVASKAAAAWAAGVPVRFQGVGRRDARDGSRVLERASAGDAMVKPVEAESTVVGGHQTEQIRVVEMSRGGRRGREPRHGKSRSAGNGSLSLPRVAFDRRSHGESRAIGTEDRSTASPNRTVIRSVTSMLETRPPAVGRSVRRRGIPLTGRLLTSVPKGRSAKADFADTPPTSRSPFAGAASLEPAGRFERTPGRSRVRSLDAIESVPSMGSLRGHASGRQTGSPAGLPPAMVIRKTSAPKAQSRTEHVVEERALRQRIVETVDRTVVEAVKRQLELESQLSRRLTGQVRSELYHDLVLERERLGVS